MDAQRFTFTVFTPTFNRAHTLHRVYESLRSQTFSEFEWLIVDDGSTDGTRELVSAWGDAPFPVRYVFQENAGKHVAFNRGVREARGDLFLTLDSDDAVVPHALERFAFHWDAIPPSSRPAFSAVTALCMDEHGALVGDPFPRDVMDSDSLELYFRHRVRGEKFGFHRTDVLRSHPFPEPPGVKFVSESVVWFAIARRYRTRFVNECLRVYHQEVGGAAAARMRALSRTTVEGRLLFHRAVLNDYGDYLPRSPAKALQSLLNYSRYSFLCGFGVGQQLAALQAPGVRLSAGLAAPVGYLLSLTDGGLPDRADRNRSSATTGR